MSLFFFVFRTRLAVREIYKPYYERVREIQYQIIFGKRAETKVFVTSKSHMLSLFILANTLTRGVEKKWIYNLLLSAMRQLY